MKPLCITDRQPLIGGPAARVAAGRRVTPVDAVGLIGRVRSIEGECVAPGVFGKGCFRLLDKEANQVLWKKNVVSTSDEACEDEFTDLDYSI